MRFVRPTATSFGRRLARKVLHLFLSRLVHGTKFQFWAVGYCLDRPFRIRIGNSQFHSIYWFDDCYEPDVTACIELFLTRGGTFVDVGANWGHHSIYASIVKQALVEAFEPSPAVSADLRQVIGDLNLCGSIQVHQVALSDSNGSAILSQSGFESGRASLNNRAQRDGLSNWMEHIFKRMTFSKQDAHAVKTATFDSIWELNRQIDLIKIDVEGVEIAVIQGMFASVSRSLPTIVCEIDSNTDFRGIAPKLTGMGYRCFKIESDNDQKSTLFSTFDFKPQSRMNIVWIHELRCPIGLKFGQKYDYHFANPPHPPNFA
jgi:FkbM family methyltransferase